MVEINKTLHKTLKEYEGIGFNDYQMRQIRIGFLHGLSKEQVDVYAKKDLDCDRMYEIRWGLEHGQTIEQMTVCAMPNLNWRQTEQLRLGFKNGLSIKQVKSYADPKKDFEVMKFEREKLETKNREKKALTR